MALRGRMLSVESLRGLAASGVLIFHVDDPLGGPRYPVIERLWLGVPLFFVLSGFLLYRPFAAATVSGAAWPDLRRYARARVLRILPGYWLALTVAIGFIRPETFPVAAAVFLIAQLVLVVRGPSVARVAVLGVAAAIAIVSWSSQSAEQLATFVPRGIGDYAIVSILWHPHAIGPAWTLWFELCFYLTLPLLALAAHAIARGGRSEIARAARAAAVLSLLIPIGILWLSAGRFWAPSYFDQFAVGMLLALALQVARTRALSALEQLLLPLVGVAIVVVAELFVFSVGAVSPAAAGSSVLYGTVMAIAFAFIVGAVVREHRFEIFLRWRPLVFLGTVSYGIYLWHALFLRLTWRGDVLGGHRHPYLLDVAIVLTATVIAASCSWFLVEKPALRYKGSRRRAAGEVVIPPESPSLAQAPAAG